ncbi:MAG: hypothetical protein EAZ89_00115 [Bacteroidetes bacterium]|nr:MAG: hypothetical protein EAZ89_00115 [Bacteroidota bacterium]
MRLQLGSRTSDVLAHIVESSWPSGISTLDARNANRPLIQDYKAWQIAALEGMALLYIPATRNTHMPAEMRPASDIYFLIGEEGIGPGDPADEIVETIFDAYEALSLEEESEDKNPDSGRAYIINPLELVSTYQLLENEEARELLLEFLSEDDLDYLAELCHEDAWPSGISSYQARDIGNTRELMKEYVTYFAASFEDNGKMMVMVYVPFAQNQQMPEAMRPQQEEGFYMIFRGAGVRVK